MPSYQEAFTANRYAQIALATTQKAKLPIKYAWWLADTLSFFHDQHDAKLRQTAVKIIKCLKARNG